MSICCIVNEKFRENVPAWEVRLLTSDQRLFYGHAVVTTTIIIVCFLDGIQVFKKEPDHFPFFFKCVREAVLADSDAGFTLKEQTVLLVFLDHCFNSLVGSIVKMSL